MGELQEKPQLVAIYFSGLALIVEVCTLAVLLLGKSKAFTNFFNLPEFKLDWNNPLFLCLVGQILCVEMFHVFNIWEYTSPLEEASRCNYAAKMVVFFYVFQCFFLYLFLMIKVRTTLLTHTKFTQYLDLILRLLTFGVIPSLMILVFFLFTGEFVENGAGQHICVMVSSPYWIMVLVFLDIVLNAGFLLLFILPIMQLIKADEVLKSSEGNIAAKTSSDSDRRKMLMVVAKRNLIATTFCVVISVAALSFMIWEAYAEDVNGKVFGCFPCVVASITNTYLMLITTKGAWRRDEGAASYNKDGKPKSQQRSAGNPASPSQRTIKGRDTHANSMDAGEQVDVTAVKSSETSEVAIA
jgi:uncharacterized membrane protein